MCAAAGPWVRTAVDGLTVTVRPADDAATRRQNADLGEGVGLEPGRSRARRRGDRARRRLPEHRAANAIASAARARSAARAFRVLHDREVGRLPPERGGLGRPRPGRARSPRPREGAGRHAGRLPPPRDARRSDPVRRPARGRLQAVGEPTRAARGGGSPAGRRKPTSWISAWANRHRPLVLRHDQGGLRRDDRAPPARAARRAGPRRRV